MSQAIWAHPDPNPAHLEPVVTLGAVTDRAAAVLHDLRVGSGMPPWPTAEQLAEDLRRNPPGNLYRSWGEHYRWVVLADGRPVGWIGLRIEDWRRRRGELGYGLVPAARGRGIMTRALRVLVEELFARTVLDTLVALSLAENRPSRRVLAKLGFRPRVHLSWGVPEVVLASLSRGARPRPEAHPARPEDPWTPSSR
jgi:RimJ/RimL family protein N-acetyltransferase